MLTSDGRGGTMCALYWQVNDVWAAPTWASIDFNLNWKALHYYAKRFFAPVIVSLVREDFIFLLIEKKKDDLILSKSSLK